MPEHNVWTDWRGNDYTVGDTVLYARLSGRSCEMAEGTVTDIYEVYRNTEWKWVKLAPGQTAPLVTAWKCYDADGNVLRNHQSGRCYSEAQVMEPVATERRAKIMPTMRTSRFNSYEWSTKKWLWDEKTGMGEFVDKPMKPITLTITESLTVPTP